MCAHTGVTALKMSRISFYTSVTWQASPTDAFSLYQWCIYVPALVEVSIRSTSSLSSRQTYISSYSNRYQYNARYNWISSFLTFFKTKIPLSSNYNYVYVPYYLWSIFSRNRGYFFHDKSWHYWQNKISCSQAAGYVKLLSHRDYAIIQPLAIARHHIITHGLAIDWANSGYLGEFTLTYRHDNIDLRYSHEFPFEKDNNL